MLEETKEIELSYATVYYERPIVHLIIKESVELGFPEIRELTAHAESLSDYQPYLVLSDVSLNVNVTQEGRRITADPKSAPLCVGCAVVVKNSMLRMAANFFSKKPRYPFRAFTDKQKAIEWLLKLPRPA